MLTFNQLEEHLDDLWNEHKKEQSFDQIQQSYKKTTQITQKIKQSTMTEEQLQQILDEYNSPTVLVEIIRNQTITESFIKKNEKLMTYMCWFDANMTVPYGERYIKYLLKKELISWDEVAMFQPMSAEFAVKYAEHLHIEYMKNNENIDQELFDKKGIYVAMYLIQL